MKRMNFCLALAAGILLAASAPAQTRGLGGHFGLGFGGRHFHHYGSRFGFGLGFGYGPSYYRTPIYRNAFTADVSFAERSTNDFRAAYEKRGDPLGVKSDVQRMDEDMEQLRREAEYYGGATIRGREILHDALNHADAIDRRIRSHNDRQSDQWMRVYDVLNSLDRSYRAR